MGSKQKESEIHDLLCSLSVHGIPNIIKTKHNFLKFLWLFCFLASSALCCALVVENIRQYLEYEVITKSRVINQMESTFPAVTVCNKIPFTTNYSLKILAEFLKNETNLSLENNYPNYRLSLHNFAKYELDNEQKMKLGHDFDKMIVFCSFKMEKCNRNEFKWYYDTFRGNCFQFNTGQDSPIKKSQLTGDASGLSLFLYVGNEYVDKEMLPFSDVGAYIGITDNNEMLNRYTGINLKPGISVSFGISKTVANQMPKPYSDCEKENPNSEMYLKFKKNNLKYTLNACREFCIQEKIAQDCECKISLSVLETDLPVRPCKTSSQIKCVDFTYEKTIRNMEFCDSICHLECETIFYLNKILLTQAFSENDYKIYSDYPLNNKSSSEILKGFEYFKKNFLMVKIYFEDNRYTEFTEMPKTTAIDLLSSIGGTLGLFLGISVLSIMELVEIFFQIFHEYFYVKIKTQKIIQVKSQI